MVDQFAQRGVKFNTWKPFHKKQSRGTRAENTMSQMREPDAARARNVGSLLARVKTALVPDAQKGLCVLFFCAKGALWVLNLDVRTIALCSFPMAITAAVAKRCRGISDTSLIGADNRRSHPTDVLFWGMLWITAMGIPVLLNRWVAAKKLCITDSWLLLVVLATFFASVITTRKDGFSWMVSIFSQGFAQVDSDIARDTSPLPLASHIAAVPEHRRPRLTDHNARVANSLMTGAAEEREAPPMVSLEAESAPTTWAWEPAPMDPAPISLQGRPSLAAPSARRRLPAVAPLVPMPPRPPRPPPRPPRLLRSPPFSRAETNSTDLLSSLSAHFDSMVQSSFNFRSGDVRVRKDSATDVQPTDDERLQCVVCLVNQRSHVPPCGHFCCCHACSVVPSVAHQCPVCRATVPDGGWRRIFI